jgi:hypothetical protein
MKVKIDGKEYEKGSEEYEWAMRVHRFRKRFIAKLPYCPKCGNRLAEYVFGLPIPEVMELAEDGYAILEGCCVSGDEPRYHCNHCDKDYGGIMDPEFEEYLKDEKKEKKHGKVR